MKMRCFKVVVVLLGLIGAVLVIVFIPPWEEEQFTDQHFDRLKEGMSKAEVINVMGGPAGDYTKGTGGPYFYGWYNTVRADSIAIPARNELRDDEWYGLYGAIHLRFDQNGLLSSKTLLGSYKPPPPSIWQKLKLWWNPPPRIEILG